MPKTARPTRQVRPMTSPTPVADRRDAVQGALDAGPVVLAEAADALDDVGDVLAGDRLVGEELAGVGKAGLGQPAEVEHQLDQRIPVRPLLDRPAQRGGQDGEEEVEVVGGGGLGHGGRFLFHGKRIDVSRRAAPSPGAERFRPATGILLRPGGLEWSVMAELPCDWCGYGVWLELEHCPHCARPGLFPNVRTAQLSDHRNALDLRYQTAVAEASGRGATIASQESRPPWWARGPWWRGRSSRSTVSRPPTASLSDFLRAARRPAPRRRRLEPFAAGGGRDVVPRQHGQGPFRRVVAGAYRPHQLWRVLGGLAGRHDSYRATVFEENSAQLLKRRGYEEPPGSRALWDERAKLCVAKLAEQIEPATPAEDFAGVLLQGGATSGEDRFVEVHIWGSMTHRAFARVTLTPGLTKPRKAGVKALAESAAEDRSGAGGT